MTDLATNVLSYGDNLDILRRSLPDAAVDLVYLDPPFNSKRDDNVIFRDKSGNATDAQLLAFEDAMALGSIGSLLPASARWTMNSSIASGRRSSVDQ
jgi:16S rRNA G966 N2-methylase RsmD